MHPASCGEAILCTVTADEAHHGNDPLGAAHDSTSEALDAARERAEAAREAAGERRCALSIRINRQITASGVPGDFATAVWQLALEPGETGFRLEHDLAGLMTAPLAAGVADAMHALLRAASAQDTARCERGGNQKTPRH